ncbi:MAG TPA: hypothetical protein VL549_06800 [Gemmatimonadales bacterium]|jgi:hypothetical protein|nr:hypothetical protein [Gemmatimonadales bacterium]
MRRLLGFGLVLGLAATGGACKDSPSPVDFTDPAAISANLSAVDSTFDNDVYRGFNVATARLSAATSAPVGGGSAALLQMAQPQLRQNGGRIFLPNLLQAAKLQQALPNLSVAAAQGRIIPDSIIGRVFQWDTTLHEYTWQDSVVAGLNGVRFILYATDVEGAVVEPVVAVGTLDIIDQSTTSKLQLEVLVQGLGGTPSYVDYTASLTVGATTATATANGFISNGKSGADGKTLTFDQTFSVRPTGATVNATFALNNPAITLAMYESVAFSDPNIVITADFRLVQNGSTIRTVGRITLNTATDSTTMHVAVSLDGHPVASIDGDPSNPGTQWVDAGGQPLSIDDLAALDHLFAVWEHFQEAVTGLFAPISTFATL